MSEFRDDTGAAGGGSSLGGRAGKQQCHGLTRGAKEARSEGSRSQRIQDAHEKRTILMLGMGAIGPMGDTPARHLSQVGVAAAASQ